MKPTALFAGIAAAAILSGVAIVAQAHARLQQSTPADGAVVASPPSNITLGFSEAARVMAAWIQKGTEPKQKLESLPDKPATSVTITLPKLAPGSYSFSWRAVGDDGHVVPGTLHFSISADDNSERPAAH